MLDFGGHIYQKCPTLPSIQGDHSQYNLLINSIPTELQTAFLTYGQLQSLREHMRAYITVHDILKDLIIYARTEDNPTAEGHPMLSKHRQALKDLETDLNMWIGNVFQCVKCAGQHLTKDCSITQYTENPLCANCNGSGEVPTLPPIEDVIKTVLPAIKNANDFYDKMYALIKAASEVFEKPITRILPHC
ncbi:hypothetical protein CEXT_382681 [Caerostris extrusa]|uniref:Uncharacterized protein n=1 Tax=Caerostris extrusa TaxID=172846 RepID=A0AAV4XJI3_CAEEX|nr:hypothetical protein CEXT_382681 [Caerostris extrusa]